MAQPLHEMAAHDWHFASVIATELTIAKNALAGLRGSLLPPAKTPYTYAHNNRFGLLTLLLAVSLIPDAILTHLLVPMRLWWLALALDVLAIYSLMWSPAFTERCCRAHTLSIGIAPLFGAAF